MGIVSMRITDRKTGQEPGVAVDGRITLTAEREWLVQAPKPATEAIVKALGLNFCERLTEELLLIHFGNAVGFFDIAHIGRVEVVSGKWNHEHFDQMLGDIMVIASNLPFAAGSGGALPFDRSVISNRDVLYHAFAYLRYVMSDKGPAEDRLLPALRLIVRDPHRRFERIRRQVPIEHASRVTASGMINALSNGARIAVRNPAMLSLPFVKLLHGHLPQTIEQHEVRTTLDTPENRFVLMFLRFAEGVISGMNQEVEGQSVSQVFRARVQGDCADMLQRLAPFAGHPMWSDVGPLVHLPAGSPILQRKRGYRETYRHFSKARLASRVPLTPNHARDLLEAKDIAHLYELWTFFMLVRAVEGILGAPVAAESPRADKLQVSVPYDFRVAWLGRATLYYNRTYSRSAPTGRRSYSVSLRPDITLEVAQGPNKGLHLFDAKFKLDRIDDVLKDSVDGDEQERSERQGTFKRGDLYKMHAYRDAIDDVLSVWILYPGTAVRLFHSNGTVWSGDDALGDNVLSGVGAVPLSPATGVPADLTTVLNAMLDDRR